jgi:hypothetical protein
LLAFCAAVVLLAGCLASGKAYLWCIPLQQAMHECCCVADHEANADEQPAVRFACCDVRTVGVLPAARAPSAHHVVPAAPATRARLPLALVDPAALVLAPEPTPQPARPRRYGLARAGPWFASDACVRLHVLHC